MQGTDPYVIAGTSIVLFILAYLALVVPPARNWEHPEFWENAVTVLGLMAVFIMGIFVGAVA
jgi:hypothetical protein